MEKKILAVGLIISFCFGLGYFHKHFRSDRTQGHVPMFFSPIAEKKNSLKPWAKPTAIPFRSQLKPKDFSTADLRILKNAKGAELFAYLFNGEFENSGPVTAEVFQTLKERFALPYTKETYRHVHFADHQASDRLGLLKAFAKKTPYIQDKKFRSEVSDFYQKIALDKKEYLMVRRQALRALVRTDYDADEMQKSKRQAQQDRQILSLAAMSDEQMIEALLEK